MINVVIERILYILMFEKATECIGHGIAKMGTW